MWYLIVSIPDLCILTYFHSNTGLDPLEITKLPSQDLMSGHYWPVCDNGPLLVVVGSSLPQSIKKNKNKINVVKVELGPL